MAGDRVDQLLRPAELLEQPQRGARVAVLVVVEVGVALVVEVVDEAGDRPQLLVAAELARVGAHRRLDPEQVLAQRVGLDPLADQIPGLVARRLAHRGIVTLPRRWRSSSSKGGAPLSGEITAAGNKNAALPILAACLLTDEEVVLTNVPRIRDTETQVARARGPRREGRLDGRRRASPAGRRGHRAPLPTRRSSARIRASFLLAGPLLARFGEARMPPPGGDFIGRRRLDPHLDAFRDMGAEVERRAR